MSVHGQAGRLAAGAVMLGTTLVVAACGGGSESAAVKNAERTIASSFHGSGKCSELRNGRARCRVITFKQDPSVLECTFPRRSGGWECRDARPTRAEATLLRRHAPHATAVIHVVSVGRLSVPRRVVASGRGTATAPFRFPRAFSERSRLRGKGPSLYLTINRDHYEEDFMTDTGNNARVLVSRRSGRLLSDWEITPTGAKFWDATTRVLEIERDTEPSYFGGATDPLSVFERERRAGMLRPAGDHRYVGERHTLAHDQTWTVDALGIPTRFQTHNGEARIDVRFRKLEKLPLTPELRRLLRIGRHPHARVIHTTN